MESVYYKNLGSDKRYYDAAVRCLLDHRSKFAISSDKMANEIVTHVKNDHPELFAVSPEFRIYTSGFKKEVELKYIYSLYDMNKIASDIEKIAAQIIGELINPNQSEYDKVRVLHDYLKCNLEYDLDMANNNNLSDRRNVEAHSIVGAFLKHKCVCEGFAKAMKYLCDRVGVECWVVFGNGNSSVSNGPHGWNIVRINGYYHHVDVTWDNQYSDDAFMPNYGYFCLSDEEIAKDHTWDRRNYPQCPSSPYNFFRVNNALLDSKAQFESFLYNAFQNEEEIIMFRVVRGSMLEQQINGCLEECVFKAAGRCKYISVPTFRYGSVPQQLTYFVRPEYNYN